MGLSACQQIIPTASSTDTPNLQGENQMFTGMANPASVYCQLLGYTNEIQDTDAGQVGVCVFPDNTSCEEWAFLNGTCGQAHSYCALQGLTIQTVTDDSGGFSQEYAVCVDEKSNVVGTVADLSGLTQALQGEEDR